MSLRRRSTRLRRFAPCPLAATIILSLGIVPTSAGANTVPQVETSQSIVCPNVIVLGAAGSGERDGAKAQSFNGVGPEVHTMWQRIHADLSAQKVTSQLWEIGRASCREKV